MDQPATHYPYYASQCGMTLRRSDLAADAPVTVAPRGGGRRQWGWAPAELLDHPHRKPPRGTGTDLAVITELATRLGRGARFTAESRAVFEVLRRRRGSVTESGPQRKGAEKMAVPA